MNYFIYTSHHFIPYGRYELNKLTSLPMCGFIAQLVEHRTRITEVTSEWCKARNITVNMRLYCPKAPDGLLNKFYVEIRKKDGTDYEPDSLGVMQAVIDRYLGHENYLVSIITGREFTKSQEKLHAKAKKLRRKGRGIRPMNA